MADTIRIPIIRIYGSLIVSIQVALSDQLVTQLKDDITAEIQRGKTEGLIIDVSGIDVMDSYISRAMHDIAYVARLMGVRTILSGMAPMIAMTMVEMGMELKGIRSALNLEAAIRILKTEAKRQDDLPI